MRKMNFENEPEGDDELMIGLLKGGGIEAPGDELMEKTMLRILEDRSEKKFTYTPLSIPLFMMLVIVFLMLIPFLIPFHGTTSIMNVKFPEYPTGPFLMYAAATWLAVVILVVLRIALHKKSKLQPEF